MKRCRVVGIFLNFGISRTGAVLSVYQNFLFEDKSVISSCGPCGNGDGVVDFISWAQIMANKPNLSRSPSKSPTRPQKERKKSQT